VRVDAHGERGDYNLSLSLSLSLFSIRWSPFPFDTPPVGRSVTQQCFFFPFFFFSLRSIYPPNWIRILHIC
jgi:hypothetical protein